MRVFSDPIPHRFQNSPIEAAIVFAVAIVLGLVVYRFLTRGVARLVPSEHAAVEAKLVEALRTPMMLWILLVALLLAFRDLSPASMPALAQAALLYGLLGLIVVSFTMTATRLTTLLLSAYFTRKGQPINTLTITLVRMLWAIPGVLLVMNLFGISLAPVLTALGVGGLAVALGLRDTLANLFAGFYVIIAGQFDQGDYVRLSTGEEGYVHDIRWRMTSLKTLADHLILIPNSKLAEAIVQNFSKPTRLMTLTLPVRIAYDSDLELAEKLMLEAAAEVAEENPDLMPQPPPKVSVTGGLADSGMELSLIVTVPEYQKQFKVLGLLRRAILRRFQQNRLGFALPVRRVIES